MTIVQEPAMGRFSVDVELTNHRDQIYAEAGLISAAQIPHVRVRGVVDSGAM